MPTTPGPGGLQLSAQFYDSVIQPDIRLVLFVMIVYVTDHPNSTARYCQKHEF